MNEHRWPVLEQLSWLIKHFFASLWWEKSFGCSGREGMEGSRLTAMSKGCLHIPSPLRNLASVHSVALSAHFSLQSNKNHCISLTWNWRMSWQVDKCAYWQHEGGAPSIPLWFISQLSVSGRLHWFIRALLTCAIKEGERRHETVARFGQRRVCEQGQPWCQTNKVAQISEGKTLAPVFGPSGHRCRCWWMSASAASAVSAGCRWDGCQTPLQKCQKEERYYSWKTHWNMIDYINKCVSRAAAFGQINSICRTIVFLQIFSVHSDQCSVLITRSLLQKWWNDQQSRRLFTSPH